MQVARVLWLSTIDATNLKESNSMRGKTGVLVAVILILATGAFAASKTKNPSVAFTTLYNVTDSSTDGGYIFGTPVIDANGNIFGTAESGGASGYGTVWSLSSSGSLRAPG